MSKHTLGPWKIVTSNANRKFIDASIRPEISPFKGVLFPIAKVHHTTHEFGIANARLIAAAPELLDALREMLDRYVSLANSGDAGFWNPETELEVKAARAAIAKAEGTS